MPNKKLQSIAEELGKYFDSKHPIVIKTADILSRIFPNFCHDKFEVAVDKEFSKSPYSIDEFLDEESIKVYYNRDKKRTQNPYTTKILYKEEFSKIPDIINNPYPSMDDSVNFTQKSGMKVTYNVAKAKRCDLYEALSLARLLSRIARQHCHYDGVGIHTVDNYDTFVVFFITKERLLVDKLYIAN